MLAGLQYFKHNIFWFATYGKKDFVFTIELSLRKHYVSVTYYFHNISNYKTIIRGNDVGGKKVTMPIKIIFLH